MKRLILILSLALTCSWTHGVAQSGWEYTALGDSYATGYLATEGYVPRYQGYLQSDTSMGVTLYNLGQNGMTSTQLLSALRTKSVFQTAVSEANVLTWDIGNAEFKNIRDTYQRGKCGGKDNQDCLRTMVSTFNANCDAIISEILSRRQVSNTIIRTIDIYYPWVAIDQKTNTTADSRETGPANGSDFMVIAYYLNEMNDRIAQDSAIYQIPLGQVHAAFNGASGTEDPVAKGYIASDGQHPSDAGHEVIAESLRALGYAPLH